MSADNLVGKYCPETFLKACGATGCLGLQVEQEDRDQKVDFWFQQQPFALLGRNQENDIILNDRRISRRHAYLQILGGEVWCLDMNSRTGTHWQDGPRMAGWLAPMQSLQVGGRTVRLLADTFKQPHFSAFDPMAHGCLQQPLITLEFLGPRWNHIRWPMNRMLAVVGRALCCKVRLHGTNVAPVHASLVSTAQGSWVIDLLSHAGTWVNGQMVRLAQLEDGDELRIGNFVMRVRCHPADRFALRPALAAAPSEPARSGSALRGQITKLNLEFSGKEVTPSAPTTNPQTLQHVVEHTAKAMLESVVFPMVQQFSAVQDQMFDQFQQAITLMFNLFGGLQKEQMQFLRDELTRVQQLTLEIQALHAELETAVAIRPGTSLPKKRGLRENSLTNGTSPGSVSVENALTNGTSPGSVSAENAPANGTSPRSVPAENAPANGTSPRSTSDGACESRVQTAEEVHALLCRRMAELQSDRRTRLQKIVDFLAGQ
jgi:pSer/pThr/pTyr-binding forkhead associated (FHA) protein